MPTLTRNFSFMACHARDMFYVLSRKKVVALEFVGLRDRALETKSKDYAQGAIAYSSVAT
jgi:hypothetical protein